MLVSWSLTIVTAALSGIASAITIPIKQLRAEGTDLLPTLTNAERIAHGLALGKPKRLYEASRVRSSLAKRSAIPDVPIGSTSQVALSSASNPLKRGPSLLFLAVQDDGSVVAVDEPALAADWLLPETFEDGVGPMRWIPVQNQGGFLAGQPYYLVAEPTDGIYSLTLVANVPFGAVTSFLAPPAYDGDMSPTFTPDNAVQPQEYIWIEDSDGKMYFAPDIATALKVLPNSKMMLAQSYATEGGVPTTANAAAALTAQPLNPARIYATAFSGDFAGYIECSDGFCDELRVGASEELATTFYVPTLADGKKVQALITEIDGQTYTITSDDLNGVASISSAVGSGSAVSNPAEFLIPSSESGFVTLSDAAASRSWSFFTDADSQTLYSCQSASPCRAKSLQAVGLCVEMVPQGQQPSYCASQIRANKNPVQLYITQISPVTGSDPAISGWIKAQDEHTYITSDQSQAANFHLPDFDGSSTAQQLTTTISQTVNVLEVMTADQGTGGRGQPFFVPESGVTGGFQTSWISTTSLNGGIVTPVPSYHGEQVSWKWFYIKWQNELWTLSDRQTAQDYNPVFVEVCVETVTPGGTPTGACQPLVEKTYPQCATQLVTGGVSIARMTGYDSQANSLNYIGNESTEAECIAKCNEFNSATPNTCTGVWWFPLGPSMNYPGTCYPRSHGQTWQKDWVASTQGNEMALIGTCSQWANNVPADMLEGCCENPASY